MNLKKFLKSLLGDTSVYFTLLAAGYCLMMIIVNVEKTEAGLRASTLLFLALFSLLAAFGRSVLRLSSMSGGARSALHYVILTFAFYLCLLVPAGMNAAQVLVGLALFSAIYWIAAGIIRLFAARLRKNREQIEKYEAQFSKKK